MVDDQAQDVDQPGEPERSDTGETLSMQGQMLMEGGAGGLAGLALGAVLAAGATVWLRLRRHR